MKGGYNTERKKSVLQGLQIGFRVGQGRVGQGRVGQFRSGWVGCLEIGANGFGKIRLVDDQ